MSLWCSDISTDLFVLADPERSSWKLLDKRDSWEVWLNLYNFRQEVKMKEISQMLKKWKGNGPFNNNSHGGEYFGFLALLYSDLACSHFCGFWSVAENTTAWQHFLAHISILSPAITLEPPNGLTKPLRWTAVPVRPSIHALNPAQITCTYNFR